MQASTIITVIILALSIGWLIFITIYHRKQRRKSAEQQKAIDESKKRDAEIFQMLKRQGRA